MLLNPSFLIKKLSLSRSKAFVKMSHKACTLVITVERNLIEFKAIVYTGESVISTALGATATRTRETALVGGLRYSSNMGWNKGSQSFLDGVIQGCKEIRSHCLLGIKCSKVFPLLKFHDSYKAPPKETAKDKGLVGEVSISTKKKGRSVAITIEDIHKRKNDVKARTTLLLALPDEHQLIFSKYDSTKELWEAILKTFSGNEATKKTKKNQLKQQYGNFKAEGSETLEQIFNRLASVHHSLRNRDDLDTMSLDDVYNHLNVYEPEITKKSRQKEQAEGDSEIARIHVERELEMMIAELDRSNEMVAKYLNSDESRVTYTEVSSPFEDLLDIESPRANDQEHLELHGMLEDLYIEPYVEDASPTAQSLESDLEAYLEEDDDEDPKEDLVDYPADGGDDGNDEEGSSEDDDMDIKADEEEEEEHPDPADSVVVALPAADQAPSAEETKPFETDESAATPPPHLAYRMTARISIPALVPVPAWSDSKVARLLGLSSPPSSPLSPLSSPPSRIPFPPLPLILSPPSHVLSPAPPPSPIPHTSSPPLQLPSTSRREDRPEVTLPPQKRLGIVLGPGYEVEESSSFVAARPAGGLKADYSFVATMDREIRRDLEREVGYGITNSWDEIVETLQGAPVSTDTELGRYIREFETKVRRDMDEINSRLDDEQSERQLLVGRLNMLFRDRRAHAYTRHLMETETRLSREAWVRSIDASDLARGEVMSLCTTVMGQTTEIRELHVADRRRQIVTSEMRRANHRRFAEIRWILRILTGIVFSCDYKKMAPKRTTRLTADQETTNTTPVTNAQLQAMIDQGVTTALAARDALRSINGHDSHNSRTGCGRMFSEESDKIERYIRGLLDMIHGSVVASKPKTMQEAVEIATELMDKKIRIFAKCEIVSKRKFENTSRSTQNQQQQQPNKRQNTGRVYTTASSEKKQYGGSKPLCAKCSYHHDGPCAPKCHKCNKVGHFPCDCRSTNNANNQRGTGSGQKPTCYECGVQGHFKRE
nr:hypothetical protein [Tanacetum cinerariifolium]